MEINKYKEGFKLMFENLNILKQEISEGRIFEEKMDIEQEDS